MSLFITLTVLITVLFFTQTPAGSPMVNGTSSPPESGVGTSLSSTTPSPRPGEDTSTARLLRHLQGRVQQLRAQNDSLRKSSENESLNDSHCSVMSTESVRMCEIDFGVKLSKVKQCGVYSRKYNTRLCPGTIFFIEALGKSSTFF